MKCEAVLRPNSVVFDANTIQLATRQVCVGAENTGFGVRQGAAETKVIWQDKGGLTTQWIDNKMRECFWEIAQSMSLINKQGAGPERSDHLTDCCITRTSDLASQRPLWKQYKADKTNLEVEKLKAALDKFAEGGLCQMEELTGRNPD